MKKFTVLLLTLALCLALSACSGQATPSSGAASASQSAGQISSATTATTAETPTQFVYEPIEVEYDADDLHPGDGSTASSIVLAGGSATVEGVGASVDGSTVTVTSGGTYNISGTLDNGQIVVDTRGGEEDEETVVLVLNGAHVTCSTGAPIYVANAEKVVISLADGTQNSVTDGAAYVLADGEGGEDAPNAAIFSHDDLTINGNGALTVHANYSHGIVSKDDLKITGGTLTVDAANDGIKGRNSIAVSGGLISVNAGGDGLQSNNDEDAQEGYIVVEGGTLNVTAGADGIQAETRLLVSGGSLTLSTGGGSANGSHPNQGSWGAQPGMQTNTANTTPSAKGLKAGVDLSISGGSIRIDSADDALHSNGSLTVSGGDLHLSSGDDGIHADASVTVAGGDLTIAQSYEGIESALITIDDGTIHLRASDDGINVSGGNDTSSANGGWGGDNFEAAAGNHLYLNGGYVYVDAGGDGLDANSAIDMSGGVVLVNGPTDNGNGPLDYLGTFNASGGFLVAVGSAGMAQSLSASSSQYSVLLAFPEPQAAGTLVHIATEGGEEVLTFRPTKTYQSVLLCSPELENGTTYVVYVGGSATGTVTDGLYTEGTYSAGTQALSFTTSGMVTAAGAASGGFPGGSQPPGGPGHGGPRP